MFTDLESFDRLCKEINPRTSNKLLDTKLQRGKSYYYFIYSGSSPVSANCHYKLCSQRVWSLAAPSPSPSGTSVPPLCILSGGVTGGSSLLSLPQVILCFWDGVDSQHIQVEQVVLETSWQWQFPDKAVRSQALAP